MDLKEFTSGAGAPETKPWLTPVVYSLEAKDATVQDRITQDNGLPTGYGLWACTGDVSDSKVGALTSLQGSYVGRISIPADKLYAGHTTRIHIGGLFTASAAMTTTFSVQKAGGSPVAFASVPLITSGAVTTPQAYEAWFDIQIAAVGAAGVGHIRSVSRVCSANNAFEDVATESNSITFDSTAGVEYEIYVTRNLAGSTTRTLGVANIVY